MRYLAARAAFARSVRSMASMLITVTPFARWLCAVGVAGAAALVTSPSHAYCRTRTCEFRPDLDCEVDPQSGCSTVGAFVSWRDRCIPFAVQRDGSEDENISAAELELLVANGF